jgi:hypothetical protein
MLLRPQILRRNAKPARRIPVGGSQKYLYADLPMQGWWVVDSGPLDFPCVSVNNMEIWRALT